jgi:hypothetical protein
VITLRECTECGRSYDPDDPRKPGKVSVCGRCGEDDVSRVRGFTVQEGKCSSTVELVSEKHFDAMRKLQRVGSVTTH